MQVDSAAPWAQWMLERSPDVEGLLQSIFHGTGLLQGGASDYLLALAIACAFPVVRLIMDRKVYGVSISLPVLVGVRLAAATAAVRCLPQLLLLQTDMFWLEQSQG
jgi:hypothetical protein